MVVVLQAGRFNSQYGPPRSRESPSEAANQAHGPGCQPGGGGRRLSRPNVRLPHPELAHRRPPLYGLAMRSKTNPLRTHIPAQARHRTSDRAERMGKRRCFIGRPFSQESRRNTQPQKAQKSQNRRGSLPAVLFAQPSSHFLLLREDSSTDEHRLETDTHPAWEPRWPATYPLKSVFIGGSHSFVAASPRHASCAFCGYSSPRLVATWINSEIRNQKSE